MYGADANWGRIICSVGYSGVALNPEAVNVSLGDIQMLKNSQPVSFSEEEAKAYLENDTVEVYVDLQQGSGIGKAWGCDLTYDYVKINASYRT